MGVLLNLFLFVTVLVPCVFGQEAATCYGAGSVAGAAIGAFIAALLLVAAAYYLRRLYWKSRKGMYVLRSKVKKKGFRCVPSKLSRPSDSVLGP